MRNQAKSMRRTLWAAAEKTAKDRLSSAKVLAGTFCDRESGALKTHHWRAEAGIKQVAPPDHARLETRGADGQSRGNSWTRSDQAKLGRFRPIAEQFKKGAFQPSKLRLVEQVSANGKVRIIAVPTVNDRTVHAVILEILEPLLDPVLSDAQHGYRPSNLCGQPATLPEMQGVARGSTRAVAVRLKRALGDGLHHMAEVDIANAFPSINRETLRRVLMADGCSHRFANLLLHAMGNVGTTKDGVSVPVQGIPLGCAYGPLLFNFFVRSVHDLVQAKHPEAGLVSYADNFYLAARDGTALCEALHGLTVAIQDLGLTVKLVQVWSTGSNEPFRVLVGKRGGGFELRLEGDGHVGLRGAGSGGASSPMGDGALGDSAIGSEEVFDDGVEVLPIRDSFSLEVGFRSADMESCYSTMIRYDDYEQEVGSNGSESP